MLEILAILYLAGMPLAGVFLWWSLRELPRDEFADMPATILAAALFIVAWPIFFGLALYDAISER